MRRIATTTILVVVGLLALGLAAGGWYYADQLLPAVDPGEVATDMEVVAVDGDTVTLRPDGAPTVDVAGLRDGAALGFQHLAGYLRLRGDPVETTDTTVRRRYEVLTGTPPATGDRGDVQATAYPEDPSVLGLEVDDVVAAGPLGELPGWRFRGSGPRSNHWVVLVHGRGSTRAEALRAVDILVGGAGYSALVVTHRNDLEAPASPDGYGHFGDTEWLDLQAWLGWLADAESPRSVTLFGYSQGGSVVASCLRRCDDLHGVTTTVLDSPLLSMQATLELQAAERDIPGPVIPPLLASTKLIASLRGGPDFANLEHVDALAGLDLPLLVWHGRSDDTVPFAPSARLAEQDPTQVTFVPHDGGHVRAWNVDPDEYERTLLGFLDRAS